MTQPRYYARFDGKEGFEERYVVVDGETKEALSQPLPYHQANDQAGARNRGEFLPMDAPIMAWCGGLNFNG